MEQKPGITRGQYLIVMGFAGFLIVIGLALLVFGVFFVREGMASRGWDVVEGEVLRTRVLRDTTVNNDTNTRRVRYYFTVRYEYRYDGETYENDRYSLGQGSTASDNFDTEEEAEEAADDAYSRGDEIDVYVDPDNPEEAVLVPGASLSTFAPLIMGAFFVLVGIPFVVVMRRQMAQQERRPY